MQIIFAKKFKKQYKVLPFALKERIEQKVKLFTRDSRDFSLHIHKLHSPYDGAFSMNITGDYRCIYKYVDKDCIILIAIGTHSELYK